MKVADLALDQLGPLPLDEAGAPLFAEPWQASAFALTVQLSEAGHFTWSEWAACFGAELSSARADAICKGGAPNDAAEYYERWLAALQALLAAKGILQAEEIAAMRDAWADAYAHTPHGQPVRLKGSGPSGQARG